MVHTIIRPDGIYCEVRGQLSDADIRRDYVIIDLRIDLLEQLQIAYRVSMGDFWMPHVKRVALFDPIANSIFYMLHAKNPDYNLRRYIVTIVRMAANLLKDEYKTAKKWSLADILLAHTINVATCLGVGLDSTDYYSNIELIQNNVLDDTNPIENYIKIIKEINYTPPL